MEPINVTAMWDAGKLKAWGSEQDALGARANLAEVSGLSMADVAFTPMSVGGGYGRRSAPKKDHLAQAVSIARAMEPAPVKLIWSREEDFAQGAYRPAVATRIEATLDDQGQIQAWQQRFTDSPELINEGFPLPYTIANQRIDAVPAPTHVRYGAWRSVAHSQHGFFTESFIDELAAAAKKDPLEFRRMHLPAGSRHRRVLDEVARRAGWGTSLPAGHGRGIALVESFGSVVAEVIEVSMEANMPRVHRVTAVVDCGFVVHPDTGAAQVQGGIVMGLSAALGEAITIKDGAVVQRSFPDYPILRMAQVPAIDVSFVESDGPLGGLGEVGLPPVAPALVNAAVRGVGQKAQGVAGQGRDGEGDVAGVGPTRMKRCQRSRLLPRVRQKIQRSREEFVHEDDQRSCPGRRARRMRHEPGHVKQFTGYPHGELQGDLGAGDCSLVRSLESVAADRRSPQGGRQLRGAIDSSSHRLEQAAPHPGRERRLFPPLSGRPPFRKD